MRYDVEWDAAKARTNLAKHGVPFELALTIFADPLLVTRVVAGGARPRAAGAARPAHHRRGLDARHRLGARSHTRGADALCRRSAAGRSAPILSRRLWQRTRCGPSDRAGRRHADHHASEDRMASAGDRGAARRPHSCLGSTPTTATGSFTSTQHRPKPARGSSRSGRRSSAAASTATGSSAASRHDQRRAHRIETRAESRPRPVKRRNLTECE